jgi:hypothetical protein
MVRTALLDVALMVVLRGPKPRGGPYLGDDRRAANPAALKRRLRRARRGFLAGVVGKDDRAVLAAPFVWTLIVLRGRIVQLPENVQQIIVRDPRRIVAHFYHFHVSGRVGAHIVVRGIVRSAAHISDARSSGARQFAEDLLNPPKAARTERRALDVRHLTNEPELYDDPIRRLWLCNQGRDAKM